MVETFDLATPQLTADANGALSPNGSGQLSYNVVLRNLGLFAPGFDGQATARGTASSSGGEYRIDTALTVPIVDPTDWSLTLDGLVADTDIVPVTAQKR